MKKRFVTCIALAALLILTLTACGGQSNSFADRGDEDSMAFEDNFSTNSGNMEMDADSESSKPGHHPVAAQGERLIYTADLQVETTHFDSAAQALSQSVETLEGYFEHQSSNRYENGRYAYYTIRIPVEHYREFLSQVGQICHVLQSQENVLDVSDVYQDTASRLATQQTKLVRLQELLAKANTMADIITIESAISETELEIESLSGSLQDYDNRIAYSTVTIALKEVYKLTNFQATPSSFGQRLAGAFTDGFRGFANFLESTAVFLARFWIPLLLLAIGITAGLFLRRKKKSAGNGSDTP